MRVSLFTWLSAVCVPVAALTASANASAATHYYALLESGDIGEDATNGEFINIQTNILHQTCSFPTYDEVNHEMWYQLSPDDARGTYWIEVGFKDGITDTIFSCKTDTLFWADSRPNGGGYNEHYFNIGINWNNWEVLQITRTDTCTWDIQGAGFDIGTSTNNCPWDDSRALSAGLETTSQGHGSAKGFLVGWWERNNNNNWNQGWDGQHLWNSAPPNIEWWNLTQSETEEVLNENW